VPHLFADEWNALHVLYIVGCIPVVADGTNQLVGMVTRTDLLRQHKYYSSLHYHNKGFADSIAARKPIIELRKRLKQFDVENE
jgi:predicted transcriptional regulator